ncbi:MAG: DEAD/DEAH box helicase [Clostridia bacterium]|nr:DEAD/DEAH box helicase [Clostridia bacterium]
MNLDQLLQKLRGDLSFMGNVTNWKEIPVKEAQYENFGSYLDPRLISACEKRGIHRLYTHQRSAMDALNEGKNIVVVTPTASGKTLCYNLPVLNEILKDNSSRALYLFPTKALSADQVSELYEFINLAEIDIKTYTYDGDTPVAARKAVRSAGHVVVTNPDMLHSGIMPHHTKWVKLFENLKFIVIDEIHTYRGVFGSHVANVIRRLKRILEFYGVKVQFICCSATIANPVELASNIIGEDVELIDNNGSPSGEKHFIFYNPPVINKQLGIRKSAILETKNLALKLLYNDISTIVFAKARLTVEVLVNYLKEKARDMLGDDSGVRGYRGGYLPTQRRQIEKGLREGTIKTVVSTNALELGIDIGSLQSCIICGYPGTISGTWQESGRAGRRNETALTIMVANSSPLSQFIIKHPEYFFESSPEHGLINPDNLYILISHIKSAAFELPFKDGETFGGAAIGEILEFLGENGILHRAGDTWHWASDNFPSSDISLRSAADANFIIIDISDPAKHKVIGEMDRFAAPMLLHDEAVYMHEGSQYQVEKLDFDNKKAYVRYVNVDYYTDADLAVTLKVLDEFETDENNYHGEVMVSSRVTMFKKIKLNTHENLGWGKVHLPELEMHTTSFWMSFDDETAEKFSKEDLESALMGVANLLANVAPMYLMCDPMDVSVLYQVRSPYTHKPTIHIYDNQPGGIGFSQKLFSFSNDLLKNALNMLNDCDCLDGCPACVGVDGSSKMVTRAFLNQIIK